MTDMAIAAATIAPRLVGAEGDVIANSLAFVRSHLDMEVAYVSEFVGENTIFRAVSAPGFDDKIAVGKMLPLKEVYCEHILAGRLPELIPDTKDEPFTQTIPITINLPVRAHVSIPIMRNDGTVYGMFCCLSRVARPSLNQRDLEVMRAFASLSADQVNSQLHDEHTVRSKREAIEQVLETEAFEIALQPILRLTDRGVAGYEALCRFSGVPYRPPNLWFDEAAVVGLQSDLELHVIRTALALMPDLPIGTYLSVNTSPDTLATGKISMLVKRCDASRVLIEITEHAEIDDLDALLMEIDRLRDLGARIAIDDAGAGYSGLQQIVRLRPDVIKLDMSLTRDVDKDLARKSLASAMVQFARDTQAHVVAEGIETEAEMRTLAQIGIELGQGYHLGKPALASTMLMDARTA